MTAPARSAWAWFLKPYVRYGFAAILLCWLYLRLIPFPYRVLWLIILGWFDYAADTVPRITLSWNAMGLMILAVLILGVLTQLFFNWLRPWPKRWTVCGLAVVLWLFVSGLAASGLASNTALLWQDGIGKYYRPAPMPEFVADQIMYFVKPGMTAAQVRQELPRFSAAWYYYVVIREDALGNYYDALVLPREGNHKFFAYADPTGKIEDVPVAEFQTYLNRPIPKASPKAEPAKL